MVSSGSSRGGKERVGALIALLAILAALTGATTAHPATRSNAVTLTALFLSDAKPAYNILIPNFERAYPNIMVSPTYAPTTNFLFQIEATELAAGNAPSLLSVNPGSGSPISVNELAKAGYLAPLVKKPWTKRSVRLVLSASKYGAGLFVFSPAVVFEGLWTNDAIFRTLGLKVPQTFSQLLDVCRKAKAAGTIPLLISLNGTTVIRQLAADITLTTVYTKDKQWARKLRAGKVTFEGTPGWHQALQELLDLKSAGCFQPGPAGTTSSSAAAQFAQGHALMWVNVSLWKGTIDANKPEFPFSHHPFPAGNDPARNVVLVNMGLGVSANAHASADSQSAAQRFIDFIARPKQDALYARINGGLTQRQLLKGELPAYAASFAPLVKKHAYAVNPGQAWWNAETGQALTDMGTGLFTGQTSVDDVLKAMDAAWKRGPR